MPLAGGFGVPVDVTTSAGALPVSAEIRRATGAWAAATPSIAVQSSFLESFLTWLIEFRGVEFFEFSAESAFNSFVERLKRSSRLFAVVVVVVIGFIIFGVLFTDWSVKFLGWNSVVLLKRLSC